VEDTVKTTKIVLMFVMLCVMAFPAMTAIGADAAKTDPGQAAAVQPIPVQILGKTIEIRPDMTRADAKTAMSSLTKEEASLDTAERLQYDIPLVPNNAPVTIAFDFDKKGTVNGFMLDSSEKKQNPALVKLLDWLQANAGKPTVKKKGSATWVYGGWKIEHTAGGSGEDASYSIQFTRSK
jgi:hypothetical protein